MLEYLCYANAPSPGYGPLTTIRNVCVYPSVLTTRDPILRVTTHRRTNITQMQINMLRCNLNGLGEYVCTIRISVVLW